MYPSDPISMRQLHHADMHVAHQRRTQGKVVSLQPSPWRRVLSGLKPRRADAPWTASHELFEGLGRNQLKRASNQFTVHDVEPGWSLGTQGAVAGEFVAILEGRIGVTIDGVPHAVLDDGSHFGALPLLDDGHHPEFRASFNVMVPSRVAVIDASRFRTLLAEFPIVAERIDAMADVRRAYLAGLAAGGGRERSLTTHVATYPVHMIEALARH